MILSCKDISKSYGTDVILTNVSFVLEEKEKCAVVGVNGAGKSTLFKIITNELTRDGGDIYLRRDARIGYLSQLPPSDENNTLYDELISVFEKTQKLESSMRDMEKQMGQITGAALDDLMRRYTQATAEFELGKGYEYKSRVKGVIKGLGFTESEEAQQINTFSGGQKTRINLGKLLLGEPDLLLLDEPTNHLDISSTEWLEDYLKSYSGAIVIISHDRYFLDRIVTKVVEIENKKSTVYNGNYSNYAQKKRADRDIQLKHYINQQKEIKRQEEMIRTIRAYATEKTLVRAKSKEKMLAKIERIERPEALPDTMRMHLIPRSETGNDVLSVENLSKSFGNQEIFRNVSFEIKKGEKVAIIGPNGVGKTTLFRIILAQLKPDTGSAYRGVGVVLGYYDQENQDISDEKTLFNEISDAFPSMTKQQIRDTLASFIFTGDDVFKNIGSLSGGERGRIALAKLMLGKANFLILDEPTNHLDIFSKEILEQTLREYTGTLMYISHDRYFINNTAKKIIELTPVGVRIYLGNYDYYLEKRAETGYISDTGPARSRSPNTRNAGSGFDAENAASAAKQSESEWRRKKESASDERKRAARLARTERRIHELESKIAEIDDLTHTDENVYSNAELLEKIYNERIELENELNALYESYVTEEW